VGNHSAFTADLREWGFKVVKEFAFQDHHVYSAGDLSRLMARARELEVETLVTTQKDAQNLPPLEKSSLPIFACVIETEIREAEAFREMLMARLQAARVRV
jgi:tetraacyldisaccharide 4'-kinase